MSTGGTVLSGRRSPVTPSPGLEEPWSSLREAYRSLHQRWFVLLTRFDLSISEYVVLRLCARAPAMASEVARAIGITPAGATDVIDRLERRRLVKRISHPADRRAVLVRISPSGERLYREAKSAERALVRDLDRAMTDEQRRALALGLTAVIRALPPDPG